MNKTLAFAALFFSLSAFSQVGKPLDTISNPKQTAAKVVDEYTETNLANDTLTSALVPLNNEDLKHRKFRTDFKENYSSSDFDYNVKKESGFLARLRELWRNFLNWFKTDSNGSSVIIDEIVNIVIVFLAIIALGFLIYYLNKKGFIRLFSKKEQTVISEKFIEENINIIDFNLLTQQAKQEHNLRKAVRYYYLWTLKSWSQNNLINYEPNKTTKQYVAEINNTVNKTAFQYISYIYDNVWYGLHEISEEDFTKIEQQFIQLINKKA